MTKKRNRLGKKRLEKMIFVRRVTKLKRAMVCDDTNKDGGFTKWVQDLLSKTSVDSSSDSGEDAKDHGDGERSVMFQDRIEPGEQGKINGREPGEPVVRLTALKRDNVAKSWLFEKYYNMFFVDKNPEGDADADALDNEEDWEHRVIHNVVRWRHKGYAVETALYGSPTIQSLERY